MPVQKNARQRETYTLDQVLDYMDCSLCYHLKYEKKLPPPVEGLTENKNILYKQCLTETIHFYYLQHQQGTPPTLKKVYDKFYSLWMERTGTLEQNSILTRPLEAGSLQSREERSKYVTKGYETLKNFYGQNARQKQAILAVNHPYQLIFDNAIFTGQFDLIREVIGKDSRRREIEVVSFQTSKRKPEESLVRQDLRLTTMHYAFHEMFRTAPDRFVLDYINRNEEIPVFRGEGDYRRMKAVLDGFVQSVQTIPPFPRPGAHLIHSPYKAYCDTYAF